MALNIDGLPLISELSPDSQILVQTNEGLKALSAEVLGAVFSNTSLYDTLNNLQVDDINAQHISTSNKVRKYFDSDTTDELYLRIQGVSIDFIKDSVVFNVETQKPVVVQATDLSGNKLYWNYNPYDCEFNNGLPWKTPEDKKIFYTRDITDYPVEVYQYTTHYIKRSEITMDSDVEPSMKETYYSKGTTSIGTIQKVDNSFILQLKETGKDPCGLNLSLNKDGTVSCKLIGTWEGVNDWDLEDVVKKSKFKWWYHENLDYTSYERTLSVNTADKIAWRLEKDTNNHVFSEIDGNYIKIYLAQTKTSGSGNFIQEQATNILGEPLYWKVDMEYQSGVSSNHIPTHLGSYQFMTIEKTDYPVYIYQYNLIELFVIDVEKLTDGSNGTKMSFKGVNGKTGEIYKTGSQFVIRYLDATGKEVSKIVMGDKESSLSGTWKAGEKTLSENELPSKVIDSDNRVLTLVNGLLSWKVPTSELPEQPTGKTEKHLISSDGNLSWKAMEKELPELPSSKNKSYNLSIQDGKLVWVEDTSEIPELSIEVAENETPVLSMQDGKLVWKTIVSNEDGTLSWKTEPEEP